MPLDSVVRVTLALSEDEYSEFAPRKKRSSEKSANGAPQDDDVVVSGCHGKEMWARFAGARLLWRRRGDSATVFRIDDFSEGDLLQRFYEDLMLLLQYARLEALGGVGV